MSGIKVGLFLLASHLLMRGGTACGFVAPSIVSKLRPCASTCKSPCRFMEESSSSSSGWMESLRARQLEIQTQRFELEQKWKNADCASAPKVALPDWVRRIDVGDYPLVACGSASGKVFVTNVETGEILAHGSTKEDGNELEDMQDTLRLLYGNYDGGGTLSIAMHRTLICSAGRQGGVQTWRYDLSSKTLLYQGSMQALDNVIVTALKLDDDLLWVGDAKGNLRAFACNSPNVPLALQREALFKYKFASTITSLDIQPDLGYGVCTTSLGSVELFSMDDDEEPCTTWFPPFRKGVFAQCAILVERSDGHSIVCGGSDGTLHTQSLNWDDTGLNNKKPFQDDADQCRPSHLAAVKCLANPAPDMLVTGGQDGSLRVWDLSSDDAGSCLYQFIGYKVWIGSIWTDGVRLVSDGNDNTIVVHDFSKDMESSD